MSEWKETNLGKMCENISYGYTASAKHDGKSPKFLRITDIVSQAINWGTVPACEATSEIIEKYLLKDGDIVIARTGATTGYNKTIKNCQHIAIFASYLIRYKIDFDIADPYFIGYILQSKRWFSFVEAISGGSAQPGANAKQFASFQFLLPPLPEQKAIAGVLSSLDDKINLLHRQNKTLESMAETLFRQWFIEEYENRSQPSPNLSQGESSKNKEEAEDDWEEVKLINCLELIIDYRGKTPLKLGYNWSEEGIPAISAKNIKNGKIVKPETYKYVSLELYKKWMKTELKKGDIIITSEAPLGEMYYLNSEEKYVLSQRLFAIRTNDYFTSEYLYFYLKSPRGQYLLKSRASGTTVQGIRQEELRKIRVVKPENNKMQEFSTVVSSQMDKISKNSKQITILEQLRDTLLPKLMSGEVRVEY